MPNPKLASLTFNPHNQNLEHVNRPSRTSSTA
jgi:hypothetical protein